MLFGCISVGLLHFLIGLSYHFGLQPTVPAPVDARCHWWLGRVSGADHGSADRGDFPQSDPGHGCVDRRIRTLDCCFGVMLTFPLPNRALGLTGAFWLFAAICVAGFVFVLRFVPETRGKSLEEIEKTSRSPATSRWRRPSLGER